MVIIDEKCLQPPPPYIRSPQTHPPPFPRRRQALALTSLPSHILLKIVYLTFPQSPGYDTKLERQRKTLYWLSIGLRLTNKAFYNTCMHVLRSVYLPAYDSLIRPPYSSDPFPLECVGTAPGQSTQRETQVLDLFIAVKVREDVWMDDSELHLEREESFKDLFDHSQPRSRLEDLVRVYGVREGLVHVPSSGSSTLSSSSSSPVSPISGGFGKAQDGAVSYGRRQGPTTISFGALSISFSPRKVGLVLTSQGLKRTIVSVARTRDETLESTAKKLVKELKESAKTAD